MKAKKRGRMRTRYLQMKFREVVREERQEYVARSAGGASASQKGWPRMAADGRYQRDCVSFGSSWKIVVTLAAGRYVAYEYNNAGFM